MQYTEAPEVETIARDLIEKFRPELGDVAIKYLFQPEASNLGEGRVAAGKCCKVDDKNWSIHRYDFLIIMALDVWMEASPEFHRAIVDHELGHVGIKLDGETGDRVYDEDTGRLKTFCRRHELEEFVDVYKRHGSYHDALRQFLSNRTVDNGEMINEK